MPNFSMICVGVKPISPFCTIRRKILRRLSCPKATSAWIAPLFFHISIIMEIYYRRMTECVFDLLRLNTCIFNRFRPFQCFILLKSTKASGVIGLNLAPSVSKRFCTAGCCMILIISAFSLLIMGFGVPAGAKMPISY